MEVNLGFATITTSPITGDWCKFESLTVGSPNLTSMMEVNLSFGTIATITGLKMSSNLKVVKTGDIHADGVDL